MVEHHSQCQAADNTTAGSNGENVEVDFTLSRLEEASRYTEPTLHTPYNRRQLGISRYKLNHVYLCVLLAFIQASDYSLQSMPCNTKQPSLMGKTTLHKKSSSQIHVVANLHF